MEQIFKLWNATKLKQECKSLCKLFYHVTINELFLQPFATKSYPIEDFPAVHLVYGFDESNKPNQLKYMDCVCLYPAAEQ